MEPEQEVIPLQELPPKPQIPSPTKSFNFYLYFIAAIVNLLSFGVGYTGVWVTPILPKLDGRSADNPFGRPITPSEASWVAGLIPLGASFGPIAAGKVASVVGRKGTLLIIAALLAFSFLITVFAKTVALFYVARFISGLAVGSAYSTISVFFAEISEDHNRGTLGCSMAIFVAFGVNFALIVGPYLTIRHFSLVCLCPFIIFIISFYCLSPETPAFLASMNEEKKLAKSLMKLRNKTPEEIHLEYINLLESAQKTQVSVRFSDLFRISYLRRGLMISLGLSVLQQGVGYGAILSYLQTIFEATNVNLKPEFCVMIVGTFQLLGTVLSSIIVDRAGRRLLLLISSFGIFLTLAMVGIYFYLKSNNFQVDSISWLPIASLAIFIVFYGLGLGPVPWVVMAELFPSNAKPVAATIVSFTCFMTMFIGTVVFPFFSLTFGMARCFFIFALFSLSGCVFIYFILPETKGKSVQQIQKLLVKTDK